MITGQFIGFALGSVVNQINYRLPFSSLILVFILGGVLGYAVHGMSQRKFQIPGKLNTPAIAPPSPVTPLSPFVDDFPAFLVQLERGESGWLFTLQSEGAEQIIPDWEAIGYAATPQPLNRIFADSEIGVLTDVLDTAVKLNLPVNHECQLKTDTQEHDWVALILSLDPQTDKQRMSGIAISVMDRRVLEQEISEEKQFADQVLEYSGVVFSVRDRQAKLIRTNKAFIEIGGYTPEEIYFAEGDRHLIGESYDSVLNQFSRVIQGDYPLVSENKWYCKDGSTRTLRWTNTGLENTEGQVNYIISVGVDITDLRLLENQFTELNRHLEEEKNHVQSLADHRMAVIDLFDTFRRSESIEDLQDILKNMLPQFIKFRDLMMAVRISRSNPGYVIKDLLDETDEEDIQALLHGGKGVIGSVIQNKRVRLCNDVSLDPVFIPHHPDVRSYLVIPIVYKDFVWGVIGLDHFEAGCFDDQDVEILIMVGTLIAMQMEEMTAKLALHQESDRLRILHNLVQEMAQARNNADILKKICSVGLFPGVHIYTSGDSGHLNPCSCILCEEKGFSIPLDVQDLESLQQISWESEDEGARYNLARAICYNSQFLGVLRVCSDLPFIDQEVELINILAEQTGVFWELNDLIAQREREAMIDPLTAVWNRRYMIARLEQEDERNFRYGGAACVAILDMGDFKLINDQYGHVKGDEVLIAAASQIDSCVRKTDYVGRYGGDEFVIFFPNTDLQEAEGVIEKIRRSISGLLLEGVHRQIEIDCGVAMVPGDGPSLVGAVRTADERMYFNKRERKRSTLLAN